jgi:hypothetical protein
VPNIEVMLGQTTVETAQNLRRSMNVAQGETNVIVSGDVLVLTLESMTQGPAGAGTVVSVSGAQPVASHSTLQKNSRIRTLIGDPVSELRGVLTAFYDGTIGSNNPYPKPWAFRVRRWSAGWQGGTAWYASRALISLSGGAIKAMNPAHIVYQCLTDRAWGLGVPASQLDEGSFYSAANTLYAEGFGLCLAWNRQTDIAKFLSDVINHVGGAFYTDRATGKFVLRLIRSDYDPNDLPLFDYNSGLLSISDDDSTAGQTSHNEVIVNYHDPIKNEARSVRVQNLAAIQSSGAVASVTVDYPGIPTADLAARAAQRDLSAQTGGLRRFKLTFDRRGRQIAPGSVFRISVPSRGISDMVIRAAAIEDGRMTAPTVTVTGLQDVFGLPAVVYLDETEGTWIAPNIGAAAPGTRRWREADYRAVVRQLSPADLAVLAPDTGFVAMAVMQPTPLSRDYVLATAATGEEYVERGAFAWCPTGRLSFALGVYAETMTLQEGASGLDLLGVVPFTAWIGSETVAVTAYDASTREFTISRGVVDTVPLPHNAGTRVWFADPATGSDAREYASGETVRLKALTRSSGAKLPLEDAFEDEVDIVGRQGRPYPPGNLRVNGERFAEGATVTGEIEITWTHRDRVLQADVLVPHEDASVGPETGTTYTIRLYDGPTLIRTASSISGTSWTYTATMAFEDGAFSPKTWELESVRDGFVSARRYRWTVDHEIFGYGFSYGVNYGSAGA